MGANTEQIGQRIADRVSAEATSWLGSLSPDR
jgi:hypothetical protein